uniref:Major facilitator superfamily (MFS) profile domain-containing protein n=1 Tax=Dendroctonus ponderosae TaxID=77166 RepID=J3JUQ1_DENPD|nr:unknown [Dendroctonus ponderosae]
MFEYSVYTILTGTLAGFIAGTSLTWTSPEIVNLNNTDTGYFNGTLTAEDSSWIGGVVSLGAALGPFIFGYLADRIGRKYTLLAISVPFAISSIITAFSNKVVEILVARLITGVGIGGAFTVLPIYVGEMSLDEHRGALGSGMNCFICFGLIFTYVVGYYISSVMIFNILLACLAAGYFVIFALIGTETPHYYVQKNKHDLAKAALLRIRDTPEDVTEKELELIKSEIEKEEQGSIVDIFRSKGTTKAFIIGSGLVFFQQASGINAVLFFAQQIFQDAGTTLAPAYCSMIIGGVQFGTSFVTPLVSNMFGRKVLLIGSAIGMALSESILGIYDIIRAADEDKVSSLSFLPIVSLVLYIITYNVGFGPLPWAVIGEIFPNSIKSSASALATSVCWLTSFIITKWFSQVAEAIGQGQCFLGFAGFSLLAAVFVFFVVLETKDKTLAEIQVDLNK